MASPMRIDVKLPGPRPTTIPSGAPGRTPSSSTAASRSPARAARPRRSGATAQTAPKDVAVSKAKITVDPHAPVRLVDMAEGNDGARGWEPVASVLGPLDERDRAVEVRLEIAPLLRVEAGDAVEVEVRHRRRGLVAVADRERRAGDGLGDAERPGGSTDERRLARPELAGDGDHVPDPETLGERCGERLRLGRRS